MTKCHSIVLSTLREVLFVLQGVARGVGNFFACAGWIFFFFGVCQISQGPNNDAAHALLVGSGFLLVPTWFLLRFGAGLFPFGRRFF